MSSTADFGGLRVAAFESRRSHELARMIERHGGRPFVSPSMREAPLEDQESAVDYAHRLITGQIEISLFLTGVGFQHLLEAVARRVDRQRFLDALKDSVTIVRGPKPNAALRQVGVVPTHQVPDPHTWREILQLIDAQVRVDTQHVGLQEYGESNPSLIAGLEARGAHVVRVPVYRWELPEDTGPLEGNIRRIAEGEVDVLMFTSANQVVHLVQLAERRGLLDAVRQGARRAVVASIGPTTSEALREHGLGVDLEARPSKMGQLVRTAAEQSGEKLERRRRVSKLLDESTSTEAASASGERSAWYDSPFMKACRREPTDVTPVWLMRQAGRYMAEYRELRGKTTFLELCKNPQLCSEIMCVAVERLGVDAAIIFSDLLPILEPMGLELEFVEGRGPVIHNPVREPAEVDAVLELESMDALAFVVETVQRTRADLPASMPLIGFAGAPFTLASYAIEGGASRHYLHTKTLMYRDEGAWRALMERLSRAIALYLKAQVRAGAQAVQLFDSWAGCLSPDDYRRYVFPHVQRIVDQVAPEAPLISFATGNPALLPLLAETGAQVIGVDWRIRLDDAWQRIGHDRAVQGNLDPLKLLSTPESIRAAAAEVLDQAGGRPGHIFNLGHGVLPQTPVENAIALVEAVHELSLRNENH